MGKKKDKKGKGAAKTSEKTERNAEKKQKKELHKQGEEDIEKLIAEFQEQDRKRQEIVEEKCPPPSQRCNMSLSVHPHKDELIMFGGEYFNGKQTYLYNDLYCYNIKNNEWSLVKSPNPPPRRCAHQAVTLPQDGGQLWVFGGEFASPTQSQFYHYKDLWVLSLKTRQWQQIQTPGAPSSRSGHRMVACKKMLLIFGGFHDNIRDYKYYNDIHAFSLETYTWIQLEVTGVPPMPRSACMMTATQDQNQVIVYGGYSKIKIKREVDQGKTHIDMFRLSVDSKCKQDAVPLKWRWTSVKQSGYRPSPRSGCSLAVTPDNRAVVFGGVYDEEEDEEEMKGVFYKDMYWLQLDKGKWFDAALRGKKELKSKRKRRRKDEKSTDPEADPTKEDSDSDSEYEDEEDQMEEDLENLKVEDTRDLADPDTHDLADPDAPTHTDPDAPTLTDPQPSQPNPEETTSEATQQSSGSGVFTVTIGAGAAYSSSSTDMATGAAGGDSVKEACVPGPRMNTMLAVTHGTLFLYGGLYEVGDRQYTLSDMYSLDLHKLDQWNTIIPCDLDLQKWEVSSSEEDADGDDEDEEDIEGATGGQEEDMDADEDTDSDQDQEMVQEIDCPAPEVEETVDQYLSRTEEFWLKRAALVAEDERLQVTDKQTKKAANRMARDYFTHQIS